MTNWKLAAFAAVPTLLVFSVAALAQESVTAPPDLPPGVRDIAINPPPGAVVKSQGRFYIWGDAPALKPPATPPSASDTPMPMPGPGQVDTLNPSTAPTTEVMRGAVGYVVPNGSYSDKWGSNARVEIGGATAKASSNLTPSPNLPNPQILSGWTLGGCSNCNSLSSIDYEGRELSVKAASDYKAEQLTLTPSISVFSSRNHQDFVQPNPGTSALDWKSTGAKVGLDSKVELNKELAFGVGGSYGLAKRDTTLSGVDVSAGSAAVPRVGNAEAKLTYKPAPEQPQTEFSLNTFAGVNNYDNKAPGIATPPVGAPSVKFTPSSDFYAGAGATYKFGTE